ncbi:MAG: hypothetical protein ACXVRE_00780 [Gaiellaceae bacterium]
MPQALTREELHGVVNDALAAVEPWLVRRGWLISSSPPERVGEPASWTKVDERHGVEYTWPDSISHFDPFLTYRSGNLELAIGFDRDGGGNPTTQILKDGVPFASFQPASDFAETGELVGIIRGREGGRKMFAFDDSLPPQYSAMTIARLSDRIVGHRFRNMACVVVNHDDVDSMLDHGRAQVELRGL